MTATALLLPEAARRGVLVISDRTARRVVEAILTRECDGVLEANARVQLVGDQAVDIAASVALRYPTSALSDTLAGVRTRLAEECTRQLGRPARTLDLTVERLVVSPPRGRRVG